MPTQLLYGMWAWENGAFMSFFSTPQEYFFLRWMMLVFSMAWGCQNHGVRRRNNRIEAQLWPKSTNPCRRSHAMMVFSLDILPDITVLPGHWLAILDVPNWFNGNVVRARGITCDCKYYTIWCIFVSFCYHICGHVWPFLTQPPVGIPAQGVPRQVQCCEAAARTGLIAVGRRFGFLMVF